MNIQTGVFLPGSGFCNNQLQLFVGHQQPALMKGAYHEKAASHYC